MTLHWVDLALMAAMVVAGFAASYFLLLHKLRQTVRETHREMERRLTALTEAINMRAPDSAEPDAASDALSATDALDATEIESEPVAPARREMPPADVREPDAQAGSDAQEISPQIQVAIAAAAIALFGNHARVRSARRIPSSNVVSPWTQQGRVIVQSSHNLRTRR